MASCNNCGNDSHCGETLRKTVDNSLYPEIADDSNEYEVCRSCRCSDCVPFNDNTR